MVIRGDVKLNSSPTSGTGDPLLTRDASTGVVGEISPIDTSVYIPTTLTSGYILVGNASNIATGVAVTGDINVSNTGVTSIAPGVIVNSDINASAAITLTKLAPTTASRTLVSDASGFITASTITTTELGYLSGVSSNIQTQLNSKQATITGGATTIVSSNLAVSRLLVSDGSGKVAVSSVTSTEAGYLSGVTSSIQTQINAKQNDIQFKDEGVNIGSSGGVGFVDFVGAGVTASHSAGTVTVTIPGNSNGLPTGGTTGQYLRKSSSTNYDAAWDTFTLSDITDVTATVSEVNILSGTTVSSTELNYLDGATGNIQTQIDSKLDNVLTQNYIYVGNASNQPQAFAPGANGYVLTSVGGVPTWQPNGVAGTLDEITDVTITSASDGDVLTYDSLSGEWINLPPTGGGGGGGHTIEDEGTPLTQRTKLNFVGSPVTVTDDSINDRTIVTITDPSQVDDTAYNASSWDGQTSIAPSKNAVRDILEKMRPFQTNVWFNQVLTIDQDLFLYASTITQISKTAGVATASYQINAGSINTITFTGNDATVSIAISANDRITWRITYTGGYTSACLSYLSNRT